MINNNQNKKFVKYYFFYFSRDAMPGEAGTDLSTSLLIVSAAVLWGATDAAIKQLSPPASGSSSLLSYAAALVSSPAYLACQLVNQAGSLLYYYALATAPLSLVR